MAEAQLHIFDLDHTLIACDSDQMWKHHAVRRGLAEPDAGQRADHFIELYDRGELDIEEFLVFQLKEFTGRTVSGMRELVQEYFDVFLKAYVYPEAKTLIDSLRQQGIPAVILTATNTSLVAPVGEYFGVDELLGTRLEVIDGIYTGKRAGAYTMGPAKIPAAAECAARYGLTLAQTAYYGDSINDRYLLEAVGFPVAANPSPALRELAQQKGWRILDFAPPAVCQQNQ